MKNKEHSLFIAYIVCLIVCFVIRVVSICVPSFQFAMWGKVVVAATISTFYFCIADIINQKREIETLIDKNAEIIINRQKPLLHRLFRVMTIKLGEKESMDRQQYDEALAEVTRQLLPVDEEKKENKTDYVFVLNLTGFFVFLIVLIVDWFYMVFYPVQDLLTMAAFIIVLITVAYKDWRIQEADNKMKDYASSIEKYDLALSMIEIYEMRKGDCEDGQNEDEDKQSGK